MTKHAKTIELIETAYAILADQHPMTLRQIYYQLVSRHVIENNRSQYQAVSNALVDARQDKVIPWEWIEDRMRRPHTVSMWSDLADFGNMAIAAYRRDVWATQPAYVEVWVEKDALSGIFEDVLEPYGVTLNVGRGYDGWSSIRNAAQRYARWGCVDILYFGDFDPSGEDMVRSLRERLDFFGCGPVVEITKCALTAKDIRQYNLPPDFTKHTDTRRAKFVAAHGDISVELDALPIGVLRDRIGVEVERRLDLDNLRLVRETETAERKKLRAALRVK